MTSPFSQFCFASSPVLFSGCYDPLAALHSSWFRAAPAPYRLRDSTFNFSTVQRDLALPIPAATRAEAVCDVSGARPVSAPQPNPSPSWRLLGTVDQCSGSRAPPRSWASAVPAYGAAPDPRPSLGVCQSLPMASALPEVGRLPIPVPITAECCLCLAAAPDDWALRQVREWHSLLTGWGAGPPGHLQPIST